MNLGLEGKFALVTGGSHGIGRAAAVALASEGCHVAIAARGAQALEDAAAEIRRAGAVRVEPIAADATKPDEVRAMVARAHQAFGRIDILVNSIGSAKLGDFLQLTEEDWQASLALKLHGIIRCCREVVPHMLAQRWGRIVNVVGHRGRQPEVEAMPAGVANAGLINFTKALGGAYAKAGILVNGVSPCPMQTRRLDYMVKARAAIARISEEAAREEYLREIPVGRFARPEEIAPLIAFLASERNSYITGEVISIDGGATRGT
ncbi:MAG TPA: SDR family oxidoreductase [Usitatibacter sp.]|nr:SDR family oxidoreductase [Usitatibacter sp.]